MNCLGVQGFWRVEGRGAFLFPPWGPAAFGLHDLFVKTTEKKKRKKKIKSFENLFDSCAPYDTMTRMIMHKSMCVCCMIMGKSDGRQCSEMEVNGIMTTCLESNQMVMQYEVMWLGGVTIFYIQATVTVFHF